MARNGKIEIKKFNGKGFDLLKLKIEDLLVDKYKWIMVSLGTLLVATLNEGWTKLDWKAKRRIWLCILDSVLLNVSLEATKETLWDKLGTFYQSKYSVNKVFLQKKTV